MNTKKGLIGVIVPVYKVEKYIAECIESILAQTYTNFRLILVDDGTPDNAGEICDEYAKKDPRITVIHQENAGVTRARARGVEEAKDCEWITFVDGDDTISANALYALYSSMEEGIDIVLSYVDEYFIPQSGSIDRYTYIKMLLEDNSMCVACWGKLYKSAILSYDIFNIPQTIRISEDVIMNLRIAFKCNDKIIFTKEQIYNHRYNVESVTNTHSRDHAYEQHLYENILESIPSQYVDYYKGLTIPRRLKSWRSFWGYKYSVKGMKDTTFYQSLLKDIIRFNYKQPFIERIIFIQTNLIVRFIAINIKKLKNKLFS